MSGILSFSKLGEYGRTANQLFQVASTYSYGQKYNKAVALPEWKYSKYFKHPFTVNTNLSSLVIDIIYNEPTFHYTEIPFIDGDVDLIGYFQSPKYFDNINVQELFELKPEYQAQVSELYNKINPNGLHTCSIHVRRGDYLKEPHLSYHGVLDMDYYSFAISKLYGSLADFEPFKKIQYIVCSDDIEWCKEHLIGIGNIHFVEGNEDIIDLFLMAHCNDNIIANSSFSWWSGYLNQNIDKRVVAPIKWFAGANLDCKDLIPEGWIKI